MYKQNGKGKLRFSQMYKPTGPVSGTGRDGSEKHCFMGISERIFLLKTGIICSPFLRIFSIIRAWKNVVF
jgi:hypothetical protein